MNIQLASDLHLDFLERSLRETRIIEPPPGSDILVLALDIHNGTKTVAPLADWPEPYLAGNHELPGNDGWPQVVGRHGRDDLDDRSTRTRLRLGGDNLDGSESFWTLRSGDGNAVSQGAPHAA